MGLELKKDKAKHFAGSFAGAIGAYALCRNLGIAALIMLIIGLGKELWDWAGHGVASWEDMYANILGIAFALVFIYYYQQKKKEKEKDHEGGK
jgi:hypothetical protein